MAHVVTCIVDRFALGCGCAAFEFRARCEKSAFHVASTFNGKGGYDTVKIDVTQTPRSTRPTTAIPVRAEE
eukprot:3139412-Prymnesium_polylepis.1